MAKTVSELRTQLGEWNPNGLPVSGQISASEINVELGRPYNAEFNIGGVQERELAQVPTGEIKFSDFHGKSYGYLFTVGFNGSTQYGYNNSGPYGDLVPNTIELASGTIANVSALRVESLLYTNIVAINNAEDTTNSILTLTYNNGTQTSVFNGTVNEGFNNLDSTFANWVVSQNGASVNINMEVTYI